jgi:hypothetical protein
VDLSVTETPVQVANHQFINKYRCPLSVHLDSLQDIPFSQPSVRAMKKQSLFPSVVGMKEKKVQESETKESRTPAKGPTAEYSLEEDLAYLRNQEKLAALNRKGQTFTLRPSSGLSLTSLCFSASLSVCLCLSVSVSVSLSSHTQVDLVFPVALLKML